ncbi:MAG TPA: hypothetical protein PLL95_18225, partial [Anaerolineales bacterium]|nr:hypothetical protein [Anaerolineales bacterium]
MKRLTPYSLILIAMIVLGACASAPRAVELSGGSAPASEPYYDQSSVMPAPTMMYATDGIIAEEAQVSGEGSGNANAAQVERIVIQNADIAVVVSDVELRMDEIQKMAVDLGGFVVSSNLYQSYTSDYTPVPEA